MPVSEVQLLLVRHAETAWRGVIRPWLEQAHTDGLTRSHIVVPTRGQAQGLKQRSVMEGLPLLGVEFLTPGLARQKWLAHAGSAPVLGRELLLFELRVAIAARLAAMPGDDVGRGLLKSLLSDAEGALEDFDELLKTGRDARDFCEPVLRELFGEVEGRVAALGYELGPRQGYLVATKGSVGLEDGAEGRLLVHGLTAESWAEFFNVAAYVRCFSSITVVLPEPEFSGRRTLDEDWVGLWERFLGVESVPVDEPASVPTCGVEDLEEEGWAPEVLVGRTSGDEMHLVADELVRLLAAGATGVAVVFPKAGAASLQLARMLTARQVPFVDLLPQAAGGALEVRTLRSVLLFYERGARLDEFLQLWPLLYASGMIEVAYGDARKALEHLFDEVLVRTLEDFLVLIENRTGRVWCEIARVARMVLPGWPQELTLSDALERFGRIAAALGMAEPPGWAALKSFAGRETRLVPLVEATGVLGAFLPDKSMAIGSVSGAAFAPVVLTTRRRAEGLAWSHLILTGSNAGVWPRRQATGGWLSDEHRRALSLSRPDLPFLPAADDRSWLEKQGYLSLMRDTHERVYFSAALSDLSEPETVMSPNTWLERALWRREGRKGALQDLFEALATGRSALAEPSDSVNRWLAVWKSRRDAGRGFDEWFFCVEPSAVASGGVPARTLEAAVSDPAVLWYEAVLGCRHQEYGPLLGSAPRAFGQMVHRLIARSLRGAWPEGEFFPRPGFAEACARLDAGLGRLRGRLPEGPYWDSFHARVAGAARVLLGRFIEIEEGSFIGAELSLPSGAWVQLQDGGRIMVSGRIDGMHSDRPAWAGANVDIVDFKTGADRPLSLKRMAARGDSLQLGVYLAAARMLGATGGRIWMIKQEGVSMLTLAEIEAGLASLDRVARSLKTGRFGMLSPDATQYTDSSLRHPLAGIPIPEALLRQKYALTFGEAVAEEENANE